MCAASARTAAGGLRERATGRRVAACVPMHTFGHPCRITEIADICGRANITLVEDAAEALGSTSQGRHAGTFGLLGALSFNGNKIVTCGGGGAILTNDPQLARQAKHLTTTAKVPHPWRYRHDVLGYNYRLPNLNAALGCGQLEQLPAFVADKRALAAAYAAGLAGLPVGFVAERVGTASNYWLNAILLPDAQSRDDFLEYSNAAGVMTRPLWDLLHTLPMYAQAPRGPLETSETLAQRLVNIPSSFRPGAAHGESGAQPVRRVRIPPGAATATAGRLMKPGRCVGGATTPKPRPPFLTSDRRTPWPR